MKKILFIVLDGLGDRPVAELGDRTPLEAADLPHLNRLAASGQQGTVITVGKGIAPESDVAVMAILGYDSMRLMADAIKRRSWAPGGARRGTAVSGWRPRAARELCHPGRRLDHPGPPRRPQPAVARSRGAGGGG